jgi:phosphate transport system substrate-binding protein
LPPIAAEFLEYALSSEAQQVIAEAGFVDQAVSEIGVNGQGLRFVSAVLPSDAEVTFEQIQEMMAALIAGDRLSITYRFTTLLFRIRVPSWL